MTLALSIALGSAFLFLLLSRLFTLEQRAGKRFLLPQIRFALDNVLDSIAQSVHSLVVYVTKYIITLSWYYSLHAFLQVVLKFLASFYYMVEKLTHQNRDRARKIRQERKQNTRTHLEVLSDHKDDTKLTENQKKRIKDKAMKGS